MSETIVAGVIHLTDLHLLVDGEGNYYNVNEARFITNFRAILKAFDGQLQHGLDIADPGAVDELVEGFAQLVETERSAIGDAPLIVLHTGDAEAFGTQDPDSFPGYRLLDEQIWQKVTGVRGGARGVDRVVQVYGNHDIWPGTFPARRPTQHHQRVQALAESVAGMEPPWPSSEEIPGQPLVEVIRVNTVRPGFVAGGIFARGRVSQHLPRRGRRKWISPMKDLMLADGSLKILVTHHPMHGFDGPANAPRGRIERFAAHFSSILPSNGPGAGHAVDDCDRLTRIAAERGVGLFIAGHRHALDPPDRASYRSSQECQSPLPEGCGQLVAQSPTQIVRDDDEHRVEGANSLSVYHIIRDDSDGTIHVTRRRYPFSEAGGFNPRQPSRIEPRVLSEIRLAE
jgi:hypothetical protein